MAFGSDGVALETPIIALRLLQHLPEGALPLARLLVLFLDPEGNLHHPPGNIPIAPQGFHRFIVITWTRGLVEERAPCILVLAHELDLLQGIFWLPFLYLLANLTDGRLGCDWDRKHAESCEHLHFWHVVLVALCDL